MSEYVKIKRKLYDELVETQAKYTVLCNMLESMTKVYEENKIKTERKCEFYADKRPDVPHSWKPAILKAESEDKQ